MADSKRRRVALIASVRTPFVRSGSTFSELGPLPLGVAVVRELLARAELDAADVQSLVAGIVISAPGPTNFGRQLVLASGLPAGIEAQSVSSGCLTGLRAITVAADAIASGRVEVGIAVGVERLVGPALEPCREPMTGLLVGEHSELASREWNVTREEQDRFALTSHQRAVAAANRGGPALVPVAGVVRDTEPRLDLSPEVLARLEPAFDPAGTHTAGNSAPAADGAAAVLLASEEWSRHDGREPLAFLKAAEYGAVDPPEGLLMTPAVVVPRLLGRVGVPLPALDLVEIHEAFAAQVLANARAWERGWKEPALGAVDWDAVNVNGGSIALGHPWSATGIRLVADLAHELARRDAALGLACSSSWGAQGGALLLERA